MKCQPFLGHFANTVGFCEFMRFAPDCEGPLEIHHIEQSGMGGGGRSDHPNDLARLCQKHHRRIHDVLGNSYQIRQALKRHRTRTERQHMYLVDTFERLTKEEQ